MNKRICTVLLAALVAIPAGAESQPNLKNKKERLSYSIGMSLGMAWKRQDIDVDPDAVAMGLKDVLSGSKTRLTETEMRQAINTFEQEHRSQMLKKRAADAKKNAAAGAAFLAANKNKPGVVTLPDGLQYKVLTPGTGPSPKPKDTVTVNYSGKLIDGKEFDSSYKRGRPATFELDHVIKGWQEALQRMKVGGKWEIYIPSDLAYGPQGRGTVIGPNSTLIFDVELLKIEAPKPITSNIIRVPSRQELKHGAKIQEIKPGSTNSH